MEALIAVGCTIGGFAISYFTFQKMKSSEIKAVTKDETEERTKVSVKLDHIKSGVDDVRLDMKDNTRQVGRINETLIRVEESAKSAHKRIDKLEERSEANGQGVNCAYSSAGLRSGQ